MVENNINKTQSALNGQQRTEQKSDTINKVAYLAQNIANSNYFTIENHQSQLNIKNVSLQKNIDNDIKQIEILQGELTENSKFSPPTIGFQLLLPAVQEDLDNVLKSRNNGSENTKSTHDTLKSHDSFNNKNDDKTKKKKKLLSRFLRILKDLLNNIKKISGIAKTSKQQHKSGHETSADLSSSLDSTQNVLQTTLFKIQKNLSNVANAVANATNHKNLDTLEAEVKKLESNNDKLGSATKIIAELSSDDREKNNRIAKLSNSKPSSTIKTEVNTNAASTVTNTENKGRT